LIPFDEKIAQADVAGRPALDYAPESLAIQAISALEALLREKFQ